MAYSNPDLQDSLLPTLEQLKRYVRRATTINPRWRDVRPLMSYLKRLAQADLNLLGLLQTRKLAVLGFGYTIAMPDGAKASPEEEKRLREIRSRFVRSRIAALFNVAMNGRLFGMSAARLTWNTVGKETLIVAKKNLELTDLDYDLEDASALIEVSTDTNTQLFSRSPIDQDTHLVVRYNPLEGIDNDFVGSFMRTNMIYVWLKYFDYFNWARGNEKFADPMVWASYRKGAEDDEIDKVVEGLEKLGTDSRAAFSDDVKIQLIESLRTGAVASHKEMIDSINREQAISILGQTLTSVAPQVGSFALGKVHNFVRQDIMWADILFIQEILSQWYARKDYELNYGEPANGFPVFQFLTDEAQDFESNARMIADLRAADVKLKLDEVYARTGFTKPEPGDLTL